MTSHTAQYELALAPIGNLDAYTSLVHNIPVLSAEEEHDLATRLHRDGDLDAAQRLVLSHLRFVVRIAKGYSGYGLPVADLIQEGNIGLMKAVKRFDPEKGVRLVSFAVHWIRAEIHEYVIRNWRIVKIATTKAQRKLFFNLRSTKQRLGWLNQDEVEAVAEDLVTKTWTGARTTRPSPSWSTRPRPRSPTSGGSTRRASWSSGCWRSSSSSSSSPATS